MTSASGISRIIRFEDRRMRSLVQVLEQRDGESVTIYAPNSARHQLVALSRVRRLLLARGYTVDTFWRPSASLLTLGRPLCILTATGKAARKAVKR